MSAPQRFTGLNWSITFNGVVVSNDATVLDLKFSTRLEERTAGNDTDASFNTTVKEGDWTLEFYGTGEAQVAVEQALRIQSAGTLAVFPKGNLSGKPIISFPALVRDFTEKLAFNQNTKITVAGVKNGAMINDIGALVP